MGGRAAQQLQKVAEKERAEADEKMVAMMKELNLLRANLGTSESTLFLPPVALSLAIVLILP